MNLSKYELTDLGPGEPIEASPGKFRVVVSKGLSLAQVGEQVDSVSLANVIFDNVATEGYEVYIYDDWGQVRNSNTEDMAMLSREVAS